MSLSDSFPTDVNTCLAGFRAMPDLNVCRSCGKQLENIFKEAPLPLTSEGAIQGNHQSISHHCRKHVDFFNNLKHLPPNDIKSIITSEIYHEAAFLAECRIIWVAYPQRLADRWLQST